MDITILREIATVASFVAFLGIWGWAYARKNRDGFEEAGRIPFEQD
ncbi:cbb3-type cytochrome c oxidase subunit 3 [Ramlibacter sp. USB13]|uniref:Cbb3-type cytochrome c oxidase subunit 3 n=1 Tax=Ramlibacter cellulosilyticus TaxID=2764187 RepID=A0A923MR85_9BURK|nr:cbb3-type cytochrome c oxidase subunit 3 [Ramlibacter cellulosilyticus]MBC5783119.1 cbb3-type cytochrome c oxidase subunit 3 [Ramlibacter cellulosilyticus]